MVSTDMHEFTAVAGALRRAAVTAFERQSADDFGHVEQQLHRLDGIIRDLEQALWSKEAKQAAAHLEEGRPLSPVDLDVLRVFLIADAQRCVAREHRLVARVHELDETIRGLGEKLNEINRDTIGEIRSDIQNALRLVPDIRHHLEQKRRIDQFEQGVQSLDPATREMMAQILRERLVRIR